MCVVSECSVKTACKKLITLQIPGQLSARFYSRTLVNLHSVEGDQQDGAVLFHHSSYLGRVW